MADDDDEDQGGSRLSWSRRGESTRGKSKRGESKRGESERSANSPSRRGRSKRVVVPSLADLVASRPIHLAAFLSRDELRGTLPMASAEEKTVIKLCSASRSADAAQAAAHEMQVHTSSRLLKAYPSCFRVASENMDPLLAWGSGIQQVALNVQTSDLPVQLSRALFELNGGKGFVLKPREMREAPVRWPPARTELFRATVEVLSLHHLPVRGEHRPTTAQTADRFVKELTGANHPPLVGELSNPVVGIELHPIGGFCCVSQALPAEDGATRHASTAPVHANGFNAAFNERFHCLAAEPRETIARFTVSDRGRLVAYETVVLGALRSGYRNLQLRDQLGTPIELCHLMVHIGLGTEDHRHASKSELNQRIAEQHALIEKQRQELLEAAEYRAQEEPQQEQLLLARREIAQLQAELQRALVQQLPSHSPQAPAHPPASQPAKALASCGDVPSDVPSDQSSAPVAHITDPKERRTPSPSIICAPPNPVVPAEAAPESSNQQPPSSEPANGCNASRSLLA